MTLEVKSVDGWRYKLNFKCQNLIPPLLKVSSFASDNDQSNAESKEIYDSLTSGKKSVSLVSKETEETAEKLANLVLSEDKEEEMDKHVADDNNDAVAAVANKSVKPSENGKYPTNSYAS